MHLRSTQYHLELQPGGPELHPSDLDSTNRTGHIKNGRSIQPVCIPSGKIYTRTHIIAMSTSIPPLNFTPIESIPSIVDRVRKTFRQHKTKPIEYRLVQLRKLYWGLGISYRSGY